MDMGMSTPQSVGQRVKSSEILSDTKISDAASLGIPSACTPSRFSPGLLAFASSLLSPIPTSRSAWEWLQGSAQLQMLNALYTEVWYMALNMVTLSWSVISLGHCLPVSTTRALT